MSPHLLFISLKTDVCAQLWPFPLVGQEDLEQLFCTRDRSCLLNVSGTPHQLWNTPPWSVTWEGNELQLMPGLDLFYSWIAYFITNIIIKCDTEFWSTDNINDLGMFGKEYLNWEQLSPCWASQILGHVDRTGLLGQMGSCNMSQVTSQK